MLEIQSDIVAFVLTNPWKSILTGLLCLNTVVQVRRYLKFVRRYGRPDYTPLFAPLSLPGILLSRGSTFTWDNRSTLYTSKGKEFISIMPILWGGPVFYSNSLEVMRQTVGSGTNIGWQKPAWINIVTSYWGRNVLTVDGTEWRRHRRILQPAFNSETYDLVWKEARRLYDEIVVSESWPTVPGQTISLPVVQRITTPFALGVILSVGFGLPSPWNEPAKTSDGKLTVGEILALHRDNQLLIGSAPWLLNIPGRLRAIRDQLEALRAWFKTAIAEKKATIDAIVQGSTDDAIEKKVKKDVFSRIVLASQSDQKSFLEDSEIIGNTWIMMFAGHETTANTLAGTLAFLAVHPREQSIVYQEIAQFMEKNGTKDFEIDSYEELVKTRSAFLEVLRLVPPPTMLLREKSEDAILRIPQPVGGSQEGEKGCIEKDVLIGAGQVIISDMIGIHRNPRYFQDPEVYKPSRWYGATSDEAYTMFANGPRACIGRKFALLEAVCFLANFLRDWEVLPDLRGGETVEQWKDRTIGQPWFTITMAISEASLTFKRR